jgi:hypothetical protein
LFSWIGRGTMLACRILGWLFVLLDVPLGAAVTSCRRVGVRGRLAAMLLRLRSLKKGMGKRNYFD